MTFSLDRKMNFDILLKSIQENLKEIVKLTGLNPVFRMNAINKNEVLVWSQPNVRFLNEGYFDSEDNEFFIQYVIKNKISQESVSLFFEQIAFIEYKLSILYNMEDYFPAEEGDYLEATAKSDAFCLSFSKELKDSEMKMCVLGSIL